MPAFAAISAALSPVGPPPRMARGMEQERMEARGWEGAEPTGLEPATSAVTGRRSNQLS